MLKKIFCIIICFLLVKFDFVYCEYILQPNDQIEISVLGQPELSKQIFIMPDGKINFPLIGEIVASGKTTKQLTDTIKEKLKSYLPVSDININVIRGRTMKLYILGEVNKPGEYTFEPQEEITLLKVIAVAGGTTKEADINKIEVINAKNELRVMDLKKSIGKNNFNYLKDGDTIFVRKTKKLDFNLIYSISVFVLTWISIFVMSKGL